MTRSAIVGFAPAQMPATSYPPTELIAPSPAKDVWPAQAQKARVGAIAPNLGAVILPIEAPAASTVTAAPSPSAIMSGIANASSATFTPKSSSLPLNSSISSGPALPDLQAQVRPDDTV